jgi:hypothetical protein
MVLARILQVGLDARPGASRELKKDFAGHFLVESGHDRLALPVYVNGQNIRHEHTASLHDQARNPGAALFFILEP